MLKRMKKTISVVIMMCMIVLAMAPAQNADAKLVHRKTKYYQFYTFSLKQFVYKKGILKVRGSKNFGIRNYKVVEWEKGMKTLDKADIKLGKKVDWLDCANVEKLQRSSYKKLKTKIDKMKNNKKHGYLVIVVLEKGKKSQVLIRTAC